MANVDIPAPEKLNPPNAARTYESNAESLYCISRYFVGEPEAEEILDAIARELAHELPKAGYQRYAGLLSYRFLYDALLTHPKARISRELVPRSQPESPVSLSESLCLVLRDRFELSCFQIAAISGSSEGSIRTRLERARLRAFPIELEETAPPKEGGHSCIKSREQIEDWNPDSSRMGQPSVPGAVSRAVGKCTRCEVVLQRRLRSLAHLSEIKTYAVPERLRKFPVSPILLKEGNKVLFNWAAAPWYVKALFEGLLATTLVLGIVLSVPRIKAVYEFWLERRLDLYSIAELAAGIGSSSSSGTTNESQPTASERATPPAVLANSPQNPVIPAEGTVGPPAPLPAAAKSSHGAPGQATGALATGGEPLAIKPETEFIGRDSEIPSSEKIYRVLIKTDAPESMKEQVVRALSSVQYTPADGEVATGAELPGGVMFDVFVPLKNYKQALNELSKVGDTKVIITRAKERGIPGKARLKIWLQRI